MWYAKMYFSEKKEVFQFDSHGVQGVPSTYKELPFLESLLSFLETDCKELEPLLRRAYENWSLLIDRDDRDAGVRTLMDLGDLGSRHIYLHLLYVRWFERFGRMGITQDRGSREDQQMLEELQGIPEQLPLVELVPGKIPQLIRDKGAADGLPACHTLHRYGELCRGKLFLPFKHPEAHHSHVRILFLQVTAGRFQHPAVQKIITVHKAEIRSLCPFESRVARCRESPVFLVDCCYTFFLCGIFVADGSAGIGGAIVHQQDLKVPAGLEPDAGQAFLQVGLNVVDRDDDTDCGTFHRRTSLRWYFYHYNRQRPFRQERG